MPPRDYIPFEKSWFSGSKCLSVAHQQSAPLRFHSLPTAATKLRSLLLDNLASPPFGLSTSSKPLIGFWDLEFHLGAIWPASHFLPWCSARCVAHQRHVAAEEKQV